MSTIVVPPRPDTATRGPRAVSDLGDQRIVLRRVGRHVHDVLDEAIAEGQHIRLAYDGKDLELMTIGDIHGYFKDLLADLLTILVEVLDIDRIRCGEKTWKTEAADRGLQADLSCYFEPEKVQAARAALGRKSMDRADYPAAPDLAIEIDASHPRVDRPAIYAAPRAAEVWRFDGAEVTIEQLQPDGTYAAAQSSRFLPISAEDVCRWLLDDEATRESVWKRRVREWAQGLRPRG